MGLIFYLFLLFLNIFASGNQELTQEEWGSFTPEIAYSYDHRFYAVQTTEEMYNMPYIKVSIYLTENDEYVSSFNPARAWDFWGICWEKDSYNIWTQSADIGVYCYRYEDGQWVKDASAVRPDDIISKYDKYDTVDHSISNTP